MNIFWTRFKKGLELELRYSQKKIRFYKSLLLVISFIQFFVISLGDVQAFFLSNNSFIPKEWTILKNPTNAKITSILFIVIVYSLIWIADNVQQSNEVNDLGTIVLDYTIPWTENKLRSFINRICRQKYNFSEDVRASIFVPVRVGFCQWRLQMTCRTENIMESELEATFLFNEGVLGYTFLKAKKYQVEFLDVSNPQNLPDTYVPLSQDNRSLINQNIKAVAVFAISRKNSIIGLLAIDTTNDLDIQILQDIDLHSDAINWINYRKKELRLIWRMKNNV